MLLAVIALREPSRPGVVDGPSAVDWPGAVDGRAMVNRADA
jgi:hypothetical protein